MKLVTHYLKFVSWLYSIQNFEWDYKENYFEILNPITHKILFFITR